MFEYLYYILGYNNENNTIETKDNDNDIKKNMEMNDDDYINKEIMNIKLNLKKTIPIKKQFYCPSIKELNKKINKIKKINTNDKLIIEDKKNTNSFIPTEYDLIKSKNNLKKTKKEKLIKKTFTDELKFAKLNLKKTTIDYRIENFCNQYLDKFEKRKNKYKNYVVTI